jgi:Holliday junction DNA helicase RuvA
MIASLRGVLQQKGLDRVVVEVGGVGYLAHVSAQTLAGLPAAGDPVHLLCHTHVREDALQIFGFLEPEEQLAFELLILVSGVGPKLALTALSGLPVRELVEAIASEDHARLQTIPGIGRKTAERLVVELKERCVKIARQLQPEGRKDRGVIAPAGEVVEALVNLGYKRNMAERAVERVLAANDGKIDLERLLRDALSSIRDV